MDNNYNVFRRAAVGGFNRQDVISYIEKMRNEFFDYKKEVEQTVGQLNEKIRELEALCEEKSLPADKTYIEAVEAEAEAESEAEKEATDAVSEINEATLKLRTVADDLCRSLCFFMEKVSENAISVVITDGEEEISDDCDAELEEGADEAVFGEENEEAAQSEVEAEEPQQADGVESILSLIDDFCFDAQAGKGEPEKQEQKKEDILEVLSTASFLI